MRDWFHPLVPVIGISAANAGFGRKNSKLASEMHAEN